MKTKDFCAKYFLLGLTFIGCGVLGFLGWKTKDINYLCAISVWVTLLAVIDCILSEQKEKKNPLNAKNIQRALDFAVTHQRGTKDVFVHELCEEMYNFLVEKGLIHELLPCDNEPQDIPKRWEVTKRGIIKSQQK